MQDDAATVDALSVAGTAPPVGTTLGSCRRVFAQCASPRILEVRRVLRGGWGWAHHADPNRLALVFMPLSTIAVSALAWTALLWGLGPTARIALSSGVTVAALTLIYKWARSLWHTTYTPRTAMVRATWRSQRLHRYRNERYLFDICTTFADRLAGRFPDRDDVELSPMRRALGARRSSAVLTLPGGVGG